MSFSQILCQDRAKKFLKNVIARDKMPHIAQMFVAFHGASGEALERKLYVCRKVIENRASDEGLNDDDFYIPSLSSRIVVYKGLFVAPQFDNFFHSSFHTIEHIGMGGACVEMHVW